VCRQTNATHMALSSASFCNGDGLCMEALEGIKPC